MKKVLFVTTDTLLARIVANHTYNVWQVSLSTDRLHILTGTELHSWDFILFDYGVTGVNAFDLLSALVSQIYSLPVFILTRETSRCFERRARLLGILDCFIYPLSFAVLHERIEDCLRRMAFPEVMVPCKSVSALIGSSRVMDVLRRELLLISASLEPVLITGESGTGKDLVASLLHQISPWGHGPYIPFNASCITNSLAESALFGSRKGGFTDARDVGGVFEQAHGGTLFLDEVAELDLSVQPKLLRVLEDRRVQRLGSDTWHAVNFRLICATNSDLHEAVRRRIFRFDLFQRINVLDIRIPPLRSRLEDIPELAALYLRSVRKELGSSALDKLYLHRWPGNVRELFGCLKRAAVYCSSERIGSDSIRFDCFD